MCKSKKFSFKKLIVMATSILLVAIFLCLASCAPSLQEPENDPLFTPAPPIDEGVGDGNEKEDQEVEIIKPLGLVDENNDIVVYSGLNEGSYLLKYESQGVALTDFKPVTTIEINENKEETKYSGLIKENKAPLNADAIGVYNSLEERVGHIELGGLRANNLGEKLYSFGAISDSHVGRFDGVEDLTNALAYYKDRGDVDFVTLCGDCVNDANNLSHLEAYQSIVGEYSLPVYISTGNHEGVHLSAQGKTYDDVKEYFSQSAFPGINQKLFYSFSRGGDVFIMLGIHGNANYGETFSKEEISWLYKTLETNKDKRCFLFHHYFPKDGGGDAVGCYSSDGLRDENGEVFFDLLSHYPNVIYFHGHTHAEFSVQELNERNTVDKNISAYNVHIPSVTAPSYPNEEMNAYVETQEKGEGYLVEVYENGLLLLGRDFENNLFSPIGCYFLETSIKEVDGVFYDKTGFIASEKNNLIKQADTWYEGAIDRSEITKVTFGKGYSLENYDETWDASANQNGQVIVYRVGSELFIVGNEYGVLANSNSKNLFKNFTALEQVTGLENFNTYNLTSFESAFENCSSLKEIDLSSLNLCRAQKFNKTFKNCSALLNFKLPESIGEYPTGSGVLINFTSTFENCTNLTEADLSALKSESGCFYYISCTFMGCSSLTSVIIKDVTVSTFAYVFHGDVALEELDLSGVNFSRCNNMVATFMFCKNLTAIEFSADMNVSAVKEMDKLFYGCEKLSLDCSNWDLSGVVSMKSINYNAPNVILPINE